MMQVSLMKPRGWWAVSWFAALLGIGLLAACSEAGPKVGDRVWIDFEAQDATRDGYAEAIVVSRREGLLEVQASRVEAPEPTDLAARLRSGPTQVPVAMTSTLEAGQARWRQKEVIVRALDSIRDVPFTSDRRALSGVLALAREPQWRGRFDGAAQLLAVHSAIQVSGDAAAFLNDAWRDNSYMATGWAFLEQVPASLSAMDATLRELGGLARLDPGGSMVRILAGRQDMQQAATLPLSPALQRVAHLFARSRFAVSNAIDNATPDGLAGGLKDIDAALLALAQFQVAHLPGLSGGGSVDSIRNQLEQDANRLIVEAVMRAVNQNARLEAMAREARQGAVEAASQWLAAAQEFVAPLATRLGADLDKRVQEQSADLERAARQAAAARAAAEEERRQAALREQQRLARLVTIRRFLIGPWRGSMVCGAERVPIAFEVRSIDDGGRIQAQMGYMADPNDVREAVLLFQGTIDSSQPRMRVAEAGWVYRPLTAITHRFEPMTLEWAETESTLRLPSLGPGCSPTGLRRG